MKTLNCTYSAIAGLPLSGKTFLIESLLEYGKREKQRIGAYKPFDINQKFIFQNDILSDAERFSNIMEGAPQTSILTSYAAHAETCPQLALEYEGIIAKKEKIDATIQTLARHYAHCWIEMPNYAYSPVIEGEYTASWIKEYTNKLIYIVPFQAYPLEMILAEIEGYKQYGFSISLLMNNVKPLKEAQVCYEWWDVIEKATNTFFVNMLPYEPKLSWDESSLYTKKIVSMITNKEI